MSSRQNIVYVEFTTLRKDVAKAMGEWVQSSFNITHVVFDATSSRAMSGPDHQLTSLLHHRFSVHHVTYQQGSSAATTFLREAKNYVENNLGARVLVVCSEITAPPLYREPQPRHQRRIADEGGVKEGKLKAAEILLKVKSAEIKVLRHELGLPRERQREVVVNELQGKPKAAKILLKVKSAEIDVLRHELGIPREKQLEARTHGVHGESSRGAGRRGGYLNN